MKRLWLAIAGGSMLLAAPARAQDETVKAGVDAYQKGEYRTAVEKWRGPAARGNADAQFNLGQAYKLGRGVPTDLTQAEDWFGKAARQGHEQAEANYGLALFENGKRSEALPWLERAVARGDARAQYVVGVMLFNGDVVTKDWVRAYALMVRASQAGLDVASKALAQMDQHIPLSDRQAGLTLARKYEEDYNRGGVSLPPVDVAEDRPAPAPSRPARPVTATTTPPAVRPAPARPAPARPAPVAAAAASGGNWRVQLGAFGDPGNARRLWAQVSGRFPGRQPYFVKTGTLTRLLVGPFASRAAAAGACGTVKPCVPVSQ